MYSIAKKTAIFKKTAALLSLAFLLFCEGAEAGGRYVFLFIGDGMGTAQRNAAEVYLGEARRMSGDDTPRKSQLVMNSLGQEGTVSTNSLSGVTDSAAAGTALAAGRKTVNGAVGMDPKTGEKFASIARAARDMGMKVGIVSTVFLQDATPAAFYGHAAKRTDHYGLGLQLTDSGFEYFGGGGFIRPAGRDKNRRDLYEAASSKGYEVIKGVEGASSGKVMAVHPKLSGGTMPWAIDGAGGPSLADFTDLGVRLLEGESGFFMMIEGGKIDLACHANDAAAAVHEVIELDKAVARAVEFMRRRPDDTLIIVTSDHETGGMIFDAKGASGADLYRTIAGRRGSYAAFERKISPKSGAKIDQYLEMARLHFGNTVTGTPSVQKAFRLSMTARARRESMEPDYKKLYGPYDPFTMACVKESDASGGIAWTTYYHTGKDVPISAAGAGTDFSGELDNTELFEKIKTFMEGSSIR
ncbi:MAG: alkaline phosphatase [Synergistaceae bacterium]|jgi:alkaline phosphatase|nr:alkaline phosphatase [Synergistaceae bacterium]